MTQKDDDLGGTIQHLCSLSTIFENTQALDISLSPEEITDAKLVLTFISKVGMADGGYDPENVRHQRDILRILSGMLLNLPQNARPANPLNKNRKLMTLGLSLESSPKLVDAGYADTPPIGLKVGGKIWPVDIDDLEGLSCLEILLKKLQKENDSAQLF